MLTQIIRGAAAGAAAGAAGTSALNAATYTDMAWRGRPSSDSPAQLAEHAADRAGITVPGGAQERGNRLSGIGALAGIGTGLAVGAAAGTARALGWRAPVAVTAVLVAAAAMAGSDGPLLAAGISDPRKWRSSDWLSDALPHLAYGVVTAATLTALSRPSRPRAALRARR